VTRWQKTARATQAAPLSTLDKYKKAVILCDSLAGIEIYEGFPPPAGFFGARIRNACPVVTGPRKGLSSLNVVRTALTRATKRSAAVLSAALLVFHPATRPQAIRA
jgi:hypothetical protein